MEEGRRQRCSAPGCREPGEFRAPLSPRRFRRPGRPGEWFCLEHVREHNARYNFFEGMTPEEIEAAQSPIAGWERATRAFAHAGADRGPAWRDFADPFDAIAARFRPRRPAAGRSIVSRPGSAMRWSVMGLNGTTPTCIKRAQALFGAGPPLSSRSQRRRSSHEKKLGQVIEA